MNFLLQLRLFKALIPIREIGTGILSIVIEDHRIETIVEVIVVGDISPRPGGRVELVEAAA